MNLSIGFKLYPKGTVPRHVAFTQHMGDNSDLDIPPGQVVRTDGYFRLPRAAVLSAFQPHMHNRGKAMCMEAIYPDIRADSARPGPARTETINCVSNYTGSTPVADGKAAVTARFTERGTDVFRATANDGALSTKSDVTITVAGGSTAEIR